ncbi:GTPase-activating protein isoform X2 [Neocloeon triangulifer]|uniref:GTPase-activating protein isoform X2 n=1 Tax=Neocloeon triangulifer TaxID=2078957 RepID=UPI00286F2A53|nr:GTPase-activating protein isoform X2 [Neocloeon triangulifer]
MADDEDSVRVEERVKIKIGEAKNLPRRSHSSEGRDVFCTLSLDQEEIYRTSTISNTLDPYFGEEFEFEVPRLFRFLSVYVRDNVGPGTSRVIGKVALRRQHLSNIHDKDHWFPLKPVDADSEVQGKVHLEFKVETIVPNNSTSEPKHRLSVRLIECAELSVKNGACDPYAVVSLLYSNGRVLSKKSRIKKKTTSPFFDECFFFELPDFDRDDLRASVRSKASTSTSQLYQLRDSPEAVELQVSIRHDTAGTTEAAFLGEVKINLQGLLSMDQKPIWYLLNPRDGARSPTSSSQNIDLGSIRLRIHYTADHVLPSAAYSSLRELLLASTSAQPVSSSAAFLLGEIVGAKLDAAQPLVRFFMHHEKFVQLIKVLATHEIARVIDPNTIFRGNSLASKLVDELMRVSGPHYLRSTLKPVIDAVLTEKKPCEVDPLRLDKPEEAAANLENLVGYVKQVFKAITSSALQCPALMCEAFHQLQQIACSFFPTNNEVRYSVISGFIFLRFFAPAILGPRLFDLTTETIDPVTYRTLTLISKTVQSLGNLVSCRAGQTVSCRKEEYMEPVHRASYTEDHINAVRQFLEIISASSNPDQHGMAEPVMLKEGMLIKRAQGRKKFGRKNFKKRFFKLTTQDLSYSEKKGEPPLFCIPLSDILAVERLQEDSFKKKNMFQIVQPNGRALYVQAGNCVAEKEWVDLLTKICQTNKQRLKHYHPAAYLNGNWLCCRQTREDAEGCRDVTSGLQGAGLQLSLDPDRELERIHSLFAAHLNKLETLKAACELQAFSADSSESTTNNSLANASLPPLIEDARSCYNTLRSLKDITLKLVQRHRSHLNSAQSRTQLGTIHAPIGDDNYLLLTTRASLLPDRQI